MNQTIFLCEDSLEGILTGVYDAWDSRVGHDHVKLLCEGEWELELFSVYRTVETDREKAEKVLRTIRSRCGEEAYERICQAAASKDGKKADAIYHTIVLGLHLKEPKRVMDCLSEGCVAAVYALSRRVWNETHHFLGFLRFVELENGILLARIRPENQILTLVAPHFADRLAQENWVIYDEGRKQAAVHKKGEPWFLVEGEELQEAAFQKVSTEEAWFAELFRTFCASIAIKERTNTSLQRQLLPLRFRPHMTEFQDRSGS